MRNLITFLKSNSLCKYKIFIVGIIIFLCLSPNFIYSQSFTVINPILNSTGVGTFKPQSKVWYYGNYWWAVIPVEAEGSDPAGTYLWRLDGTTLTKLMKLSDSTDTFADAKALGNVTHILVVQGTDDDVAIPNAELVSIQFKDNSPSPPTYESWTVRASNVPITLDPAFNEAATIDLDSQGRMWLASDANAAIKVRWSNSPYSSWSSPITLNTGHNVASDDICVVTAFDGNKIGVFWSNQREDEFQFRFHNDLDDPNTWSTVEIPVSASSPGTGVADDHINLAVGSDGSIYVAVKTSYNSGASSGNTTLALLVRRPALVDSDNWEALHEVTNDYGTRPIALLNESENKIFVIYHPLGDGDILYKYSSISPISFPSTASILDDRDNFQDITSTKQSFTDEVLILYNLDHSSLGGPSWWYGTKADASPFPVELSLFNAVLSEDRVELNWQTETEVDNYGFNIERSSPSPETIWKTIGFVEGHGNSNSPKEYNFIDSEIEESGKYSYRLKQIDNDGTFEYSDVVTVYVGTPEKFYLSQNYPNPFNPTTTIEYIISKDEKVSLKVYDLLGREVASLVDEFKQAGTYSVTFDAEQLASGVYIYRIMAGEFVAVNRMSLIR
jgi:hypothetical protein